MENSGKKVLIEGNVQQNALDRDLMEALSTPLIEQNALNCDLMEAFATRFDYLYLKETDELRRKEMFKVLLKQKDEIYRMEIAEMQASLMQPRGYQEHLREPIDEVLRTEKDEIYRKEITEMQMQASLMQPRGYQGRPMMRPLVPPPLIRPMPPPSYHVPPNLGRPPRSNLPPVQPSLMMRPLVPPPMIRHMPPPSYHVPPKFGRPPRPNLPLVEQGSPKTELCKFWLKNTPCRHEPNCRFAHGEHERRKVQHDKRYQGVPCLSFSSGRGCRYGSRCHFLH